MQREIRSQLRAPACYFKLLSRERLCEPASQGQQKMPNSVGYTVLENPKYLSTSLNKPGMIAITIIVKCQNRKKNR